MLDEATLRELAATQHGVASRVQLQQAGLTPRAIRHRIGTGRWVSIGRNVVALGPVPTDIWGRAQAGVLAVPSATVSHRTAGALHGLPGLSPATRAPIDLSTTVLSAVGPADVRLFRRTHRPRFQHLGGMAITTVPQTLFDLAAVLPVEELDRVVDLSLAQRRLPLSVLELSVEELSGRGVRGTPALRHLLASRRSEGGSESELERLFLEGWTAAGGVPGRQQVQMPWHARVDHLWDDEMVIGENDSRSWHTRERDFDSDRRRDAEAASFGYLTVRITWGQVKYDLEATLVRLAKILRVRAGMASHTSTWAWRPTGAPRTQPGPARRVGGASR